MFLFGVVWKFVVVEATAHIREQTEKLEEKNFLAYAARVYMYVLML